MGFITSLFGGTGNSIVTIGLALAVVLILIVLGVWALKLLFNATGNVRRGRTKRIMIIDTTVVDQKRQLVLIRRDNVEHLVMTGGGQDLLVESGIEPPAEQPQPVRPNRRPATTPKKSATRPQKMAPRVEQAAPPMPLDIPEDPAFQPPAPPKIVPVPAVEPSEPIAGDDAETTSSSAARGSSGQSALEKLSKLTRPKADRRSNSLRHTGLLRSVTRAEPTIHPQPSNTIAQNSNADDTDSAKTQSLSANREQDAVDRDNDESDSGAASGKTNDSQDKTGAAS